MKLFLLRLRYYVIGKCPYCNTGEDPSWYRASGEESYWMCCNCYGTGRKRCLGFTINPNKFYDGFFWWWVNQTELGMKTYKRWVDFQRRRK